MADPEMVLGIGAPEAPEVVANAGEPEDWPDDDDLAGPAELNLGVTEDQVRALLAGAGGLLAFLVGDEDVPDVWRFTDRELADLTPPLTRIVNKRPKLAAAVHKGDEVSVAVQLAGYMGRNIRDLRAAAREREDETDGFHGEAHPAGGGGPAGGDGLGQHVAGGVGHPGDGVAGGGR